MNKERNNRIDEMLNSLDGVKKAVAPDFFYTRLRAKMEKRLVPDNKAKWVLRPAYILSALFLVLAVNAFVFLRSEDKNSTATVDSDESVQQSIAAEYNLNDINTVYDLNQDK